MDSGSCQLGPQLQEAAGPYRERRGEIMPGGMDIGTAKELYRTYVADLKDGYDAIFDAHIANCPNSPVSNANYLHALFLTDRMLRGTEREFRMLSGEGCDGFLDALDAPLTAALKRVHESGGKARMLITGQQVPERLSQLSNDRLLDIEAIPLKQGQNVAHLLICDDDVRLEELHSPVTDASGADLIRARVYFANPLLADDRRQYFDALWDQLHSSFKRTG